MRVPHARRVQLLIKVDHRDVHMDEVARDLACSRHDCRHVGARLTLIKNEDTSGFAGGMPSQSSERTYAFGLRAPKRQ